MAEITSREQLEKVRGYEKGYFATRLIAIGIELGLFEKIDDAKEGITTIDLAEQLGLHEPYVKIWCQTAYSWELLDCDDSFNFWLPPGLNEVLVDKTNPRNYEGNINFTIKILGPIFDRYTEFFKSGERLSLFENPEVGKMAAIVSQNFFPIVDKAILPKAEGLKEKMVAGAKILDVGCGWGVLMTKLAQTYSNSSFIGVDPDEHGIKKTKKLIKKLEMEDRVSAECIGGESIEYNEEFDASTMMIVLHEIYPELKSKVLENIYKALKKDGKLIIWDHAFPNKIEDFRNPLYEYGVVDEWYEVPMGTIHQTPSELDHMLSDCGFQDINRFPLGKGMFEIIVAGK
ncbi:class I SAM-dependent methyltransferase [Thermodesulfobacteriota bacterium]